MNLALWSKTLREARLLLLALMALLFGFQWLFVWVTSQIKLGAIEEFMRSMPESFQSLSGVPVRDVATVAGRIALAYVDPVVLLASAVWGIARGSDAISGEINRGTMEMLLAQPVRRIEVLGTQVAVTVGGAVLLALSAFLGTTVGLATVTLEEQVAPRLFVPAAINLFALTFFLAGTATMVSSFDQYRWRTVGLMGGFYVYGLVLEVLGKMVERLNWLRYFTFLAAFEPQPMISHPEQAWTLSLYNDGVLLGLGLLAFLVASVVFCRRDLPAPL